MRRAQVRSLNRVVVFRHRKTYQRSLGDEQPKKVEEEVSEWRNISIHPHRFGGREFLFGKAEVGHMHVGGVVDIPCTRSIRDVLLVMIPSGSTNACFSVNTGSLPFDIAIIAVWGLLELFIQGVATGHTPTVRQQLLP